MATGRKTAIELGLSFFLAECALQLSGYQNTGLAWALAIGAASCAALWLRDWIKERSKAKRNHAPLIEPNWRIGEAMDYVADRLGTSEQDIDTRYRNPARLLTRQATAGKVHVWGKRISSHGPELDRREIPAEEWRNRELLIGRVSHTPESRRRAAP